MGRRKKELNIDEMTDDEVSQLLIDKGIPESHTQSDRQLAKRLVKIDKKSAERLEELDGNKADVKEAIRNATKWMGFKPAMTDDEVEERITAFYAQCTKDAEMPSMEKLALVLGVDFDTMRKWESGHSGKRRMEMLIRARQTMAAIDAELVSKRKIPEVSYIFRSKVMYGYRDTQDIVVTHNNSREASAEELLKAAELLPANVPVDGKLIEVQPIDIEATETPSEEVFDDEVDDLSDI